MIEHEGGRGAKDWSLYGAVSGITELFLKAPRQDFRPITLSGTSPHLPHRDVGFVWDYNGLPNNTSIVIGGRPNSYDVSGSFVLTECEVTPRGVGTVIFVYLPVQPELFLLLRALDFFTVRDPFTFRYFRSLMEDWEDQVRSVLHHELVHMFDLHQEPVKGSKRIGSRKPGDDEKTTWENYYGIPVERNAFTGMWGCRMRRAVDLALQHDCQDKAYLTLLQNGFNPTNFYGTVRDADHVTHLAQEKFFEHMSKGRRSKRAFYRRLYGVWYEGVKSLRQKFPGIV